MTSTTKRCKECKENLPLDLFNTLRGKPRGKCRECQNSLMREYAKKRRQKAFERSQAQSGNNPPKTRPQPRKRPKKARRTRIRAMSHEKREWNDLYKEKYSHDPLFGVVYDLWWDGDQPEVIRGIGSRVGYQKHHPARRWNWAILIYRYCSDALHSWIEANSAKARELGMLFNLECGELRNPSPHDPFNVKPEIEELRSKYL